MKVKCPFCNAELNTKDDVPTVCKTTIGGKYTCHKVICKNKEHHPDKNNIAVVFTPDKE